jgi:hypothetical protein
MMKRHLFPYDSHAIRSLSSVIIPYCIALHGEHPKAAEWLDFTVEYIAGPYPPWGGSDDYSYNLTYTSYAEYDRITMYHNGVLVWGIEP